MEVQNEIETLKNSVEISRIVADVCEKQDRSNRRLMVVCLIQSAIIIILSLGILFAGKTDQAAMDEAMLKALNAAGDVTTTTTEQTVEGDSATINNIEGEQFNDSAQKVGAE